MLEAGILAALGVVLALVSWNTCVIEPREHRQRFERRRAESSAVRLGARRYIPHALWPGVKAYLGRDGFHGG